MEKEYKCIDIVQRRWLFNSIFHFMRKLDIKYSSICVEKRNYANEIELTSILARLLGQLIDEDKNNSYFTKFDKIIIYYDKGQAELTKIISAVFSSHLPSVEFREVLPADYRLFQVSDMICTLEFLLNKEKKGIFTKSEKIFFGDTPKIRKKYLKYILDKRL